MLTDLRCLPDQIELLLGQKEKIQHFANRYVGARDIFFIGRGIDYAISLEGSLKLKEISYIHSEAYAAGELKHGTISLIEDGTLVVALATQPDLFQKTISNMVEVKARGAFVMAVTIEGNKAIEKAVGLCGIHSRDQSVLYQFPGNHSVAAVLLTMWQWDVAVMWISRETWQNPLRWNNKEKSGEVKTSSFFYDLS